MKVELLDFDQSLSLHVLHVIEPQIHIFYHFLLVRNSVTKFLVPYVFFTPLHLKGYRTMSVCYIFISLLWEKERERKRESEKLFSCISHVIGWRFMPKCVGGQVFSGCVRMTWQ